MNENVIQSTVSKRKSTSHHNFYINISCKNNNFELLLWSLFDIINPRKVICFAIFAFGVIYFMLFTFSIINSEYITSNNVQQITTNIAQLITFF